MNLDIKSRGLMLDGINTFAYRNEAEGDVGILIRGKIESHSFTNIIGRDMSERFPIGSSEISIIQRTEVTVFRI